MPKYQLSIRFRTKFVFGANMDNLDHIGIKEYHEIFKKKEKRIV